MFVNRKLFYLPIIIMMAFFGLFAFNSPVHAEDTVPPVSEAPAETQPEAPAEEASASEGPVEAPVIEIAPAEIPAPPESTPEAPSEVVEASPTETPAENAETAVSSQPEPQTPSTGLATDQQIELGEETDIAAVPQVVVVDESGNSIPLVTADAAEALVAPDPYFFVGTTKYSFMTDCGTTLNCTASINPLQTAFDTIAANGYAVVGGAVYVEANTEPTAYGSLLIDGSTWGSKPIPVSLSLIGTGAVEKSIGSSIDHFIGGTISVTGIKSFTLQAFTVKNEIIFDSNTGTLNLIDVVINGVAGNGLEIVNHSGAVNLNMVDSSDNSGFGATITNTTGTAAPVTIKNSTFNRNSLNGLLIQSNGAVSLTGVSANLNQSVSGAQIQSKGLTINQSVFSNNVGSGLLVLTHNNGGATLIQNSQFNNNSVDGLHLSQYGNVDIKNVRSSGNGSYGVDLDTCNWDSNPAHFCANPFTGNVSILQSEVTGNVTTASGLAGIYVVAKGIVAITDTYAGSNGNSITGKIAYGAQIYNYMAAVAAPVNITNSSFGSNSNAGLYVHSKGIITLKDTSATDNAGTGANLDNHVTGSTAGISVLNSAGFVNKFSNNGVDGLQINSNGAVVINAVKADNNSFGSGITVDNNAGSGAVTIDGINGTTANQNSMSGIYVFSKGQITVKNMDASNNGEYGYYLFNPTGTGGVSVLVTLQRWSNGLENNGLDGLYILSNGAVIVQKVSASNNQHNGAYIVNNTGTGNVTITDSNFNDNGNIVTGGQIDYGLFVLSKGIVAVTNINANNNGSDTTPVTAGGVYLDNRSNAPKAVTLTKATIINNFGPGLAIFSTGAVTFKTGSVNENKTNGVSIENHTAISNQAVTIDTVNIWGNGIGSYGLNIQSKGNILIKATDVNDFLGNGTFLYNDYGTGSITISGTPTWWRYFGNNNGIGIIILTKGAVNLNYLVVSNNAEDGVSIIDNGPTAAVTLANIDANSNGLFGLDVNARGNITLDNVMVVDNLGNGVRLDNTLGTGTVTIKSATGREIRNNSGYGLLVNSKGNIVLTNISIKDNDDYGALLDNHLGTSPTVTINNTLYTNWQNNGDYGLTILTPGAVIINLVDAVRNTGTNTNINNTYATGTAAPSVTISNSNFNESITGSGLSVISKGNITLTNTGARGNFTSGADLYNSFSGGKGTVTISGTAADSKSSFSDNLTYGLQILSNGAVTLKYLDASNNGSYGAFVNNSSALTPQPVTITSASFIGNSKLDAGIALRLNSKGAITLNAVYADNNGDPADPTKTDGIILDNCMLNLGYCTGSGAIKLTNVASSYNTGDGLFAYSFGVITLSDVSAVGNGGTGATFYNSFTSHPALVDIASVAGITLSQPAGYSSASGMFSENGGYGLAIHSNGAISVANVTVSNNGTTDDDAAYINNSTAATPMAVTITKSKFNDNSDAIRGILVISKGAITFSNNEVNNNRGDYAANQGAAELDNHLSTLPQNVTVTSSTFGMNNNGDGLLVLTKGNVLLTNLIAFVNADDGITVNATYGNGTVTLNGTRNSFIGNKDKGAELLANGNVSVTNITAELNEGDGLAIDNCGFNGTVCTGTGTGGITVSNANLNRNFYNGIWTSSNGAQTLTNVTALSNGYGPVSGTKTFDGAHLLSRNKDITITNSSFTGNGGSGIWSDTGAANWLKLVGTLFYGNSMRGSGYPNLYWTGYKSIS